MVASCGAGCRLLVTWLLAFNYAGAFVGNARRIWLRTFTDEVGRLCAYASHIGAGAVCITNAMFLQKLGARYPDEIF